MQMWLAINPKKASRQIIHYSMSVNFEKPILYKTSTSCFNIYIIGNELHQTLK